MASEAEERTVDVSLLNTILYIYVFLKTFQ